MPNWPLAVRGPFRGVSGHDHHTREFVRQLARQGVRLQLTDIPEWHPVKLPPGARDPWFEQLATPVAATAVLHFCMPHQVLTSPGRLTVNYTMFEADRVPAGWIACGRRHDLVIVPTASSRQAWLAAGHPSARIKTCPLGVDMGRFRPGREPLSLTVPGGRPVADFGVRVLNVSEPLPRKNLAGLVRTWITATSADDDAVLVVKLAPSSRRSAAALFSQLAGLQRSLGRSLRQAAPVLFVDRLLAEDEMPRLYAAASHYWSMSHGEGWDQPMIEAAAAGLRLIAPRHTAYLSYLDAGVAQMVPSRPVPADASADPWTAPLFDGARWWSPEQDAACQAVRNAVEGRDQPAADIRGRLASSLTWRHAADRLIDILVELHAEHGRRFLASVTGAVAATYSWGRLGTRCGQMTRDVPPDGEYRWQSRIGRLVNGMPIEVDPRDMIGSHILRSGVWEPEIAAFFLSWLRPGMTVVDAGAHVGHFTLLASGAVAAGGRVIAFEPHPVLGQVLCRNVERAGCANVTVSSLALGRARGRADLVLHPSANFGASSLRADGDPGHRPRVPVVVTTLDDYLERTGEPRVDLIKLDVEGAEPDVIEGARRTLAASPGIVLVVEFLRENARRFGRDVEDLEARLRELGFLLFTLTPHGPRPYERVGELAANVVAVRRLITLLGGLPESVAAQTLVRLARARRGSTGRPDAPVRSGRLAGQGFPQPGGHPLQHEGGRPAGQGPAE